MKVNKSHSQYELEAGEWVFAIDCDGKPTLWLSTWESEEKFTLTDRQFNMLAEGVDEVRKARAAREAANNGTPSWYLPSCGCHWCEMYRKGNSTSAPRVACVCSDCERHRDALAKDKKEALDEAYGKGQGVPF